MNTTNYSLWQNSKQEKPSFTPDTFLISTNLFFQSINFGYLISIPIKPGNLSLSELLGVWLSPIMSYEPSIFVMQKIHSPSQECMTDKGAWHSK